MYPKWVTRAYGIGPVLCLNAEEEAAVLADWQARDKPAEQPKPVATLNLTQDVYMERDIQELRAMLDKKGVKYDKRWGAEKLAEALKGN